MKIRRILYLSLGLERVYAPKEQKRVIDTTEKLIESDGAKVCRRNILALAAVVVVASAAGANPRDLDVFGIKPPDDWGVLVLGATIILAHLYWYVLRYYHMRDDGKIECDPNNSNSGTDYLKINWNDFSLVRRGADLFSNWVAFVLTCLSWWCIGLWIVDRVPQ